MPISGPLLNESIDLRNLLHPGLKANPHDSALVSAETRWSWRDLDDASGRLAANLLALGLRPGDRVASLMPNRAALLVHYVACLKAGLVAAPLNYRYMPAEIDYAIEVSSASILLAHAEREPDIAVSKLANALPLGVISYGAGDASSPNLEALINQEPPSSELPYANPTDPAFIFFTSGSTGKPKGVTHTIETFGCMIASAIKGLELTPRDVVLPGSSLSHIGALLMSLIGLAAGARVVVTRTFDGDELLPLLREDRPTVLEMLPAALFSLVRDHGATREDFRSIRLCVSGGDKVSRELEQEFTELTGFPIDEGYGMTEIGFATLNPPLGLNKMGSVGRLLPGFAASLRSDSGNEVLAGEDGRLWIKSPTNTVGYWGNREATGETIRDGWLDTGDLMKVDEDGYFWFRGRKKQIIIHDGSNICPQEVEEALLEHRAVESAGVVGIHNLVHGENVRAYITLKAGGKRLTSQEIIRFARDRVGYKAPEEIVVLEKMPLNPTGKVDRVSLKRMAEKLHSD
jgi:long-chain acyl-CoA synthetase